MGLIEQAKLDLQQFTSDKDTGFGVEMTFKAPTGESAVVVGLHTKHHLSIDEEGNPVNAKNTHCSVSEQLFIDAGYPIRDKNGEVNLKDHKVTAPDNNGKQITYVVDQWFPDETVGFIVCVLGDSE